MRRLVVALVALTLACLTFLVATPASAESVASLKKKLLGDSDFRVRTQAALALGASGSKAAVDPLCKGLNDDSDTVRAAAAAALGRLAKGGKACLERRKNKESSANVKKMISKALRLLAEARGGPSLGSAKYYLAFGRVNVRGDRKSEIASYTKNAMRRALARKRGFAFAPVGESTAQAKKRLRKHPHVAGYFLESDVVVEYSNGDLVVELEVQIKGYPNKDSQGSLREMTGTSAGDKDKALENAQIDKVASKAMKQFASLAASVQ